MIPTETAWMPNRINQQQEYTITEAGFRHEWGLSSYYKNSNEDIQDIIEFKNNRVDELYNSLPEHLKIEIQ